MGWAQACLWRLVPQMEHAEVDWLVYFGFDGDDRDMHEVMQTYTVRRELTQVNQYQNSNTPNTSSAWEVCGFSLGQFGKRYMS